MSRCPLCHGERVVWSGDRMRAWDCSCAPTPDRNPEGEKPQALSAKHESGLPEGSSKAPNMSGYVSPRTKQDRRYKSPKPSP